MSHIPRILNCAAVKVLAVLNETQITKQSNSEVELLQPLNDVTQLAICQKKGESRYQMYFCNDDWTTLSTEYFDSLETARRYAEAKYPGIGSHWITPALAAQYQT